MALVFVQCVVNYLYAIVSTRYILRQTGEDTTKSSYYAICSFSYLTAMVTSNKALMWVNYPTQVVGKSCKPIPVMVLGVLIGRKRYPALKYLFVLLIVAGVAMFMYKDDKASASKSDTTGILGKIHARTFFLSSRIAQLLTLRRLAENILTCVGIGEILLLVSLTCDGVTGAVQERMKSEHQTKSGHMMRSMNKWSIFFLAIALTATGELWDFSSFVARHPSVMWQIGLFSVASALGQYFIFMCVSEFGPLPCSICTTTRKFFTVLASVVFFGNALVQRQWLGATLVFIGV